MVIFEFYNLNKFYNFIASKIVCQLPDKAIRKYYFFTHFSDFYSLFINRDWRYS